MRTRVTLTPCPNYQPEQLDRAIEQALAPLGGIERFVQPGQRVFIKCNLLMKRRPETATTTHPEFVAAVVRLVQKAGAIAILGDSPGGPFTEKALQGVYDLCGMTKVAESTGCELNFNCNSEEVYFPGGKYIQRVPIIEAARKADVIINLPKLKTHGITLITAGVKNLFGLIPGLTKIEYHLRMPNHADFSAFLVELAEVVKPDLTITDAIVGMEGHGPSGGEPIQVGAIIASSSPYANDVVAAHLAGTEPAKVTTITAAMSQGIDSGTLKDIELIGPLQKLQTSFELPQLMPRVDFLSWVLPRKLADRIVKWVSPRPVFIPEVCASCGVCVTSCPPKALTGDAYPPKLDLDKCIRCFCCQELCPVKAIKIHQPGISRLVFKSRRQNSSAK